MIKQSNDDQSRAPKGIVLALYWSSFDCLINHDQQCSVGPEKHAVLNGKVMPLLAETACRSSGIPSRGEKKSNHIGFLMLFWSKKI